MVLSDSELISIVLRFEGGFTDNPADHGGPTNYGITAATLGRYRNLGRAASRDEVQALTRAEAVAIYASLFIKAPAFDRVKADSLRLALVDSGVISGPSRAIAWLRQCLKMPATPKPVAALDDAVLTEIGKIQDQRMLPVMVLGLRLKACAANATQDRSQAQFMAGWVNRVVAILEELPLLDLPDVTAEAA